MTWLVNTNLNWYHSISFLNQTHDLLQLCKVPGTSNLRGNQFILTYRFRRHTGYLSRWEHEVVGQIAFKVKVCKEIMISWLQPFAAFIQSGIAVNWVSWSSFRVGLLPPQSTEWYGHHSWWSSSTTANWVSWSTFMVVFFHRNQLNGMLIIYGGSSSTTVNWIALLSFMLVFFRHS